MILVGTADVIVKLRSSLLGPPLEKGGSIVQFGLTVRLEIVSQEIPGVVEIGMPQAPDLIAAVVETLTVTGGLVQVGTTMLLKISLLRATSASQGADEGPRMISPWPEQK
jgi:hypothetical protein